MTSASSEKRVSVAYLGREENAPEIGAHILLSFLFIDSLALERCMNFARVASAWLCNFRPVRAASGV